MLDKSNDDNIYKTTNNYNKTKQKQLQQIKQQQMQQWQQQLQLFQQLLIRCVSKIMCMRNPLFLCYFEYRTDDNMTEQQLLQQLA